MNPIVRAVVVSLVLVAAAAAAGVLGGRLVTPAAPSASPPRSLDTASPAPGPVDPNLLFQQPLSATCVTRSGVYAFADGGMIGRFDGTAWSVIDPTLRSISAAVCSDETAVGVGALGRVVTIDERGARIQVDTVVTEDLRAASLFGGGLLAVGSRGTVQLQAGGWQPYAQGIDDELYAALAFSGASAWIAGAEGVAFRLGADGWRPSSSGTRATLRALAGASPDDVIAAGDGGVVLRFTGGAWQPLASGTSAHLRAASLLGTVTWIAGDGGVLLAVENGGPRRVDLGTTCALRGLAVRGEELWIVGSDGARAGIWRRIGDRLDRWGAC